MDVKEFLASENLVFRFRDLRDERVKAKISQAVAMSIITPEENLSELERTALIYYVDMLMAAKREEPNGQPTTWREWATKILFTLDRVDYWRVKAENWHARYLAVEGALRDLLAGDRSSAEKLLSRLGEAGERTGP